MGAAAEVGSNLLLFALVFGMSATVDIKDLKRQLGNRNALLTGVFLQFVVLPFLGFAVVKALNLSAAMGVTLLVVTSSPGGSYSNWWCSMFNADLALSVTMTAISTLLSIVMLPVNLTIYTTFSYSGDVVKNLDWVSLFISLVVVIGAIAFGLFVSARVHSHRFNMFANKLGNVAGISLVVFSILVSGPEQNDPNDGPGLWDRDWVFYCGVAAPCVLGLVCANLLTSFLNLARPERVTTSVECCYQNVGIATSVAISMFEGDELAEAVGVPLFYGLVEAVVLGFYCIGAWKIGWTKAPKDESLCVVIMTSYEVESAVIHDVDAIEVVLGMPKDGGLPSDLIFSADEETGYQADEGTLVMVHTPGRDEEPPPPPPPFPEMAPSKSGDDSSKAEIMNGDGGVLSPAGSVADGGLSAAVIINVEEEEASPCTSRTSSDSDGAGTERGECSRELVPFAPPSVREEGEGGEAQQHDPLPPLPLDCPSRDGYVQVDPRSDYELRRSLSDLDDVAPPSAEGDGMGDRDVVDRGDGDVEEGGLRADDGWRGWKEGAASGLGSILGRPRPVRTSASSARNAGKHVPLPVDNARTDPGHVDAFATSRWGGEDDAGCCAGADARSVSTQPLAQVSEASLDDAATIASEPARGSLSSKRERSPKRIRGKSIASGSLVAHPKSRRSLLSGTMDQEDTFETEPLDRDSGKSRKTSSDMKPSLDDVFKTEHSVEDSSGRAEKSSSDTLALDSASPVEEHRIEKR